mmetsp:Transcript_603/g.1453  ORF Transcript_603/g.1453 Transcript_603/m.1453 type:complete len:425 (+) Transcript_603:84-1358(+)|eukprot:CAMPEP_0172372920 /NCGR_PEP_ID=MMETSP1060-20121228/49772_1 /TAXON_ID=37318 /ORGANISM="Pseudo-nitzschia pungens, Strain cf. cingulata" /LENGTH=424 /DNA_ID=CAMNT_0013099087 /DNA_START=47 /DNA_END=1321 /DNA_ORIENTATION=-
MINLAVHYNNLGVDILSGARQLLNSYSSEGTNSIARINKFEHHNGNGKNARQGQMRGEPSRKRRKLKANADIQAQESLEMEARTDHKVDDALAYFQKALALIVQDTELHYYGNGLKYHPSDEEGFLRYDNEEMGKELVAGIKPCDTGITLKGEESYSNEYIYWKAVKIGTGDERQNYSEKYELIHNPDNHGGQQRHTGSDDYNGQHADSDSPTQEHHRQGHSEENCHLRYPEVERLNGEYESLTKSIYHSMICIFNIGLCYHYKGMVGKARHMKLMTNHDNPFAFGFNFRNEYSDFLNASVDHYTQAYELMTRFRLEDGAQYTFLMAMMNNLAATYGSLGQTSKVEVCNRYLVQSLTLVICSSERDGHLGQEILSQNEEKSMLREEEDRSTFESFLSNVMHLMLNDGARGDQRCSGNTAAAAAA